MPDQHRGGYQPARKPDWRPPASTPVQRADSPSAVAASPLLTNATRQRLPWRLREWSPIEDIRAAWQRSRRGYASRDAWSFDSYLALVIAGGVDKLIEANHGHPGNLPDVETWHDVLRRIRDGFATYAEGEEWDNPTVQEAVALFAKWFPHLWD